MISVTLTNIYSSETLQTLLIILTITQTIKHVSEMYQNWAISWNVQQPMKYCFILTWEGCINPGHCGEQMLCSGT